MMNHLVTVAALFVCLKLANAEVCGEGWSQFGKSCYFFSDSAETWYAASEICYDLGGHLVRITSQPENEWLKARAKAKNYFTEMEWKRIQNEQNNISTALFFIDGTDEGTEEIWRWASNQQKFTFNDRYPKEKGSHLSGGKNENCMVMSKGYNYQWGDVACTTSVRYVCEKEIENEGCCCAGQKN